MPRLVGSMLLCAAAVGCDRPDSPGSRPVAPPPAAVPSEQPPPRPTTALPSTQEHVRHGLQAIDIAITAPPYLSVSAYRDREAETRVIVLKFPGGYEGNVKPAYEFERDDVSVTKQKEWLLQRLQNDGLMLLLEADDALVYEADEPEIGHVCGVFATKDLGEERWSMTLTNPAIDFDPLGRRRDFQLPETSCLDVVSIVRSLEPLAD